MISINTERIAIATITSTRENPRRTRFLTPMEENLPDSKNG
jgi:hypothetical protein